MLYFRCSPLIHLFPSPLVPVSILWWLYRVHQLQLVLPSLSCSIFFFSYLTRSRYLLSLFSPFYSFTQWSAGRSKSTIKQVLFFIYLLIYLFIYFWLSLALVVWPRLDDPFVSQNPVTPDEFFILALGFSLRLTSKWPQVCSGLEDFSEYLVILIMSWSWWHRFTLCFHLLRSFFKRSKTVQSLPTTTGISVNLVFHSLLLFQGQSIRLSFRFLSFSLCHTSKWQNLQDDKLFFLFN